MAQQIRKGVTFSTYPGTNSQVTSDLINQHVDDAILLPGAISSQTPSTSVLPASELLVLNSTTSTLNRVSVQNLVQNSAPAATTSNKGVVSVGDGLSVTTEGVLSSAISGATNGTSGTTTLVISATGAGAQTVINGTVLTGLTFVLGETYTVSLAPGSSTVPSSSYSFIFGVQQVVASATNAFTLTIPNIPSALDVSILTGCYIELIGSAGLVVPSTGNGIKVVQQTVGATTKPIIELVPATKASIGGVIAGSGLTVSQTGVLNVSAASGGYGIRTTCYTPNPDGRSNTVYTHTLAPGCNVVEAIIIGGGGAGGAGSVNATVNAARYGGGGGGGGAITLLKLPLISQSAGAALGTIAVNVGAGGTCLVSTGTTGSAGSNGNPSSIQFTINSPLPAIPLNAIPFIANGGGGGGGGTTTWGSGGTGGIAFAVPAIMSNFCVSMLGGTGGRNGSGNGDSKLITKTATNYCDRFYAAGSGGGLGGAWTGTAAYTNYVGGWPYSSSSAEGSPFGSINTLVAQYFTPLSPSIAGNGVNGSAQSVSAVTTPSATNGGGGGGGGSSHVSSQGGRGGNGVVYIIEYFDPNYIGTTF